MAKQEDEKTAGSAEAKEAPGGSRLRMRGTHQNTGARCRLLSDIFPWLKSDDCVITDTVDISETSPWLHEEHDGPRDTIESDPEQHKGETR